MSRNNRECHEYPQCACARRWEGNDWAEDSEGTAGHEDVIDEDDDGYFMGKYLKSIKFEMNE